MPNFIPVELCARDTLSASIVCSASIESLNIILVVGRPTLEGTLGATQSLEAPSLR